MTVPSLNSEQCMRETEARRGMLAALLREPRARRERPSVSFTPGRRGNVPDRGDVLGCPVTEGLAHCMARPPAAASLGIYPCGITGVSGAGRRHIRKQRPLRGLQALRGALGGRDRLLVGAAHSLPIQRRMTSRDNEKARHGPLTRRLNPRESGWTQRHVRLQLVAPVKLPIRGVGAPGRWWGRAGGEGSTADESSPDTPGLGHFHVSRGDSSCPGVWASVTQWQQELKEAARGAVSGPPRAAGAPAGCPAGHC